MDDFELYRSPNCSKAYELFSLHRFSPTATDVSINGVLTFGDEKFFIEDAQIKSYSIGGYGNDEDPNVSIYVQTNEAGKKSPYDTWYRLGKPTTTYGKLYSGFLWIAQFGRHMMDFLEDSSSAVHLRHLKTKFLPWLTARFHAHPTFEAWRKLYPKEDFRPVVNAYSSYVYNQATDLAGARRILQHPIWGELMKGEYAIKQQSIICKKTIATPFVYDCFRHMYFGDCLKKVELKGDVAKRRSARLNKLGFSLRQETASSSRLPEPLDITTKLFRPGDVVGVEPDHNGKWDDVSQEWLAYVQRVEALSDGVQRLFVIWLYRPRDTTIMNMIYPVANELFFSDNCNCTEEPLLSTDGLRVYTVNWAFRQLRTTRVDFTISKMYDTSDCSFVTLKEEDLCCRCSRAKPAPARWDIGDTVYLKYGRGGLLQPVVISQNHVEGQSVTVRRLIRLSSVHPALRSSVSRTRPEPNEFVWTNEFLIVAISRIDRACQIRFIPLKMAVSGNIPTPYNRRGNGDFIFFSLEARVSDSGYILKPLDSSPGLLKQGLDPEALPLWKPLRGLSVFSGGGNLDRGLEDAGAVHFTHAVDISHSATHTQLANARDPSEFNVYWGSVDDYLKSAMQGDDNPTVARVGEIQFVAAGSPCPGFSSLQQDKQSPQSLRNASHITTFCSLLDLYRPDYAVLENVVSMSGVRKGFESERVFSQVVGCLVALGYQVRYFLMDAWSYGSSQHRSRIIISAAAPGLELLTQPFLTHAHPEKEGARSIGIGPNGERYCSRESYPTPFRFVTAQESTADLPQIGSGFGQIWIPCPDHRVNANTNHKNRELTRRIPVGQYEKGYQAAIKFDLVPHSLRKGRPNPGRLYTRIQANGQFPTITTNMSPNDAYCGHVLHWKEARMITIMEARRAQGFPDNEILIGTMDEQFRIVGNAVDRSVSLAIGLSMRKAMDSNYEKGLLKATETTLRTSVIFQKEDDTVAVEIHEDLREESSTAGLSSHPFSAKKVRQTKNAVQPSTSRRTGHTVPQRRKISVVEDPDDEFENGGTPPVNLHTHVNSMSVIEKDEGLQHIHRMSYVVADSDDEVEANRTEEDDSADDAVPPHATESPMEPDQVAQQNEQNQITIVGSSAAPELLLEGTVPAVIDEDGDEDITITETESEGSPDPLEYTPVSLVQTKSAKAQKITDVRQFFMREESIASNSSADILAKGSSETKLLVNTPGTSISSGPSKRSRTESSEASTAPLKRTRSSGPAEYWPKRWKTPP